MGGLVEAELVHFVRRLSVVAAGEFEMGSCNIYEHLDFFDEPLLPLTEDFCASMNEEMQLMLQSNHLLDDLIVNSPNASSDSNSFSDNMDPFQFYSSNEDNLKESDATQDVLSHWNISNLHGELGGLKNDEAVVVLPILLPQDKCDISQDELLKLKAKDLNKLLRNLPDDAVRALKKKRRQLKNRSYAKDCRKKKVHRSLSQEEEILKLKVDLQTSRQEAEKLKQENARLRLLLNL